MERAHLTQNGEPTGKWFDVEKATEYDENVYSDGSNLISKATGSQWHHEKVFLTAGGKFVLNTWSQIQGSVETFRDYQQ